MFTIPSSTLSLVAIMELIGLNKLCWSILHIWAVSNQKSELDVFNLEEKTKGQAGYQLGWNKLMEISQNLDQINECTIVGVSAFKNLPYRALTLKELREVCDIVIEGVDSTTWEISVQNDDLKQKLAKECARNNFLKQPSLNNEISPLN